MPSIEIAAVGTELLLGQLIDTNTPYIAGRLAEIGLDVYATRTVGDNRERIGSMFQRALENADGVVTTGGLGPTIDDLTKEAVCDVFGCDVELNEEAVRNMQQIFERSRREMRENNKKQAMIPSGAHVLENRRGTAPGFIAQKDGKFIACMPGVPSEMKTMLAESLIPWLREHFNLRQSIYTRILHTVNIAESEIDHRIADLFARLENPKIAVLAHEFQCDVKIMTKAASEEEAQRLASPIEDDLSRRLEGHIYGVDDQTLAGTILQLLQHDGATIAVAESCTGGMVSAAFTAMPGASKAFRGGVIAYDNALKIAQLGVSEEVLNRDGAVSEQTARAMAAGARERMAATVGLATTGIAGPDGATAGKPVGLVWIGLADDSGVRAERFEFGGDRREIQTRATVMAQTILWKALARREPMRPAGT